MLRDKVILEVLEHLVAVAVERAKLAKEVRPTRLGVMEETDSRLHG